ncbi:MULTISPECIES: flagellar basal body rod protein FlgC [Thalassospira]|jgi:flagellar basal-body rod protein FlgC|uniref:Flagellar basal-body rod protein FlgC n=4 Tax=Thalassospira TaxID=168934 RepID=A0A367X3I2_9PROT|nr:MULTISPECIES: flagellar basal body rod protein FlgC [Thalassospira]MAL30404.1 flagellar basal body rod protein FlgC [Thalassospira sp.]MBR9778468.1 flagellar basal body rod protein FlgC [Rhodospirillales bacterium]PTB87338.1 flagellar basal body rod protein FlgC [Pseudidiomarina aestuarii]UKV15446.1 flagellar basal body rod protein FlgC [Thalassospiraceae bacterium SW-3-3]AJD50913.1 flagellar basal-body rod protein FlgC [Thalassospira xiamenensis M-5 = DSM 17429]|tara:strand:+ start:4101 stop:4508 length:408 start_codon:yes stop_codon:yes gene_type:complete
MELYKAFKISAAGMRAQGTRLRIAAENVANADSLPTAQGQDPYRRKLLTFKNVMDREVGVELVKVNKVMTDKSDFGMKYEPSHPAANDQGYVQTPNVETLVEMMDLREAQRSYEANLNVIQSSRSMLLKTLDILQ